MKDIVIYSSNTCVNCKAAKQFMSENNIQYEEKNIDDDRNNMQYLIDNGFRGVPVIVINDEPYLGFSEEVKENLLG